MAETVAATVAGRAGSTTASAFNRLVLGAVARLRTAEETLAAHQKASRHRTGITPLPPLEDGLGGAMLIGPAERIAEIFGWARTFTLTNKDPGDPRTVGQRRFDAIVDAILGSDDLSFLGAAAGQPGPDPADSDPAGPGPAEPSPTGPHPVTPTSRQRRQRRRRSARDVAGGDAGDGMGRGEPHERTVRQPRVALKLVLSAETLAGLNNDPGWLEGYGNLPAVLARRLAVDPVSIQRLLVHPETGQLLDLAPEMRSPNAALTRYVRARDAVCAFPGCGAQADYIDLDHIQEYQDGGPSTQINLHCLCRRHHRAKHAGGWTITRHPDGTETWTSPTGNNYRTEPTRYPTHGTADTCPNDDYDVLATVTPPTASVNGSTTDDTRGARPIADLGEPPF